MENIKTIEVKIEGKEWQDALDKAFKEANKKAKIDGFRPGHAPKEVFIKKYGEESSKNFINGILASIVKEQIAE